MGGSGRWAGGGGGGGGGAKMTGDEEAMKLLEGRSSCHSTSVGSGFRFGTSTRKQTDAA